MESIVTGLVTLISFIILALASRQIGDFFRRFNLPLISGFLFAGVLVGPYVLGLLSADSLEGLRFIDEVALGIIAFAAGNELYLKEIRDRMRSITWITAGLVLFTLPLSAFAILLLSDYLPFMNGMSMTGSLAVALLGGSILVARSPSSAIAIVNELRARGPFTKAVLGVTMIMDVVVILLFGINSSIADALLTELPFNLGFIGLLLLELGLSVFLGYIIFRMIQIILGTSVHEYFKIGSILLLGYMVFVFSGALRSYSHEHFTFEILVEPLLICMISGFLISSFSDLRDDFSRILHRVSPSIYILFFTLTGASLSLDILAKTWTIALVLFFVRLLGIFLGTFSGGMMAGEPMKYNRLGWMAFVTQAGVGLGLAKEVAVEFPVWGDAFATIIISVIVLNQIIGPPLFKSVIKRVGEAHPRGETRAFDGVRDAIIFGIKPMSITLARQLRQHDWQVKLVCMDESRMEGLEHFDCEFKIIDNIDLDVLNELDAEKADAIVCFMPREESLQVFSLAFEKFGTETLVFHSNERNDLDAFRQLGVLIVEPQTAVASLLEHFVLSPMGTSILLGQDDGQEIMDIEMRNPNLHGVSLRELRLPLDVLVLSIQRDGQALISRGFTKFNYGDKVTMLGPRDKLEEVVLSFEE